MKFEQVSYLYHSLVYNKYRLKGNIKQWISQQALRFISPKWRNKSAVKYFILVWKHGEMACRLTDLHFSLKMYLRQSSAA